MNQNNENKKNIRSTQRKIIIAAIVIIALAVLLVILNSIDYDAVVDSMFGDKKAPITYGYSFMTPDYTSDIMDEDYLSTNRTYTYSSGAVKEHNLTLSDLERYDGVSVICRYFEAMIEGNAEKYNSLFTEEYYLTEGNEKLQSFPPQRIYECSVELKADPHTFTLDELGGKYTGVTKYIFGVDYKIQFNTGTVREDIPSDASREIFFEVLEYPGGEVLINSVTVPSFEMSKPQN